MINVIIILDARMYPLKISPNLTKKLNLPKISRLLSQSLDCQIKSYIVQNICHMLVFTKPKGLLIVMSSTKVSRFVGIFHIVFQIFCCFFLYLTYNVCCWQRLSVQKIIYFDYFELLIVCLTLVFKWTMVCFP